MAKKKTEKDYSNHAYVSNYPPLHNWLNAHDARCMWQIPMQQPNADGEYEYDFGPTAYVECWLVGKRPVIVVVHANKNGWEIYTALDDNNIEATFADAEKRLGLATA
jgi:hypothetical protein